MNPSSKIYHSLLVVLAFLLGAAIPISTSLLDIAGSALIVLGMLGSENRTNLKVALVQPFVRSALFLYALFIIGLLWTNAPKTDVIHMLIKMDLYLFAPFLFAMFINKDYKKSVLLGFAVATLTASSLSIISTITHTNFFAPNGIHYMMAGKMQHVFQGHTYQNYFSGLLCIGLLAILLTQKVSLKMRNLYILAMVICLIDAFFIMPGRTGQILFVIMLILFFIQWRVKLGLILSGVLLIIVLPLCVFLSPTIRAGITMAHSDVSQYDKGNAQTSIGLRMQFHKYSKQLIKEAPFIGHGTGSFKSQYSRFKLEVSTVNPHNDYLWFAVELGIFGVLGLIGLIISTIYQAYTSRLPYSYLGVIIPITYAIACAQNSFFTDRITAMSYVVLVSAMLAGTRCKKNNKIISG